jgi:hypothetical protein
MDGRSPHQPLSDVDSSILTTQLYAATAAAQRVLSIWNCNSLVTVRISIEDLRTAFVQIMRARTALEAIPQNPSPALADARSQYVSVLEQLRPHLPRFEGWLLAERGRLDARCGHASSVHRWAEANRRIR